MAEGGSGGGGASGGGGGGSYGGGGGGGGSYMKVISSVLDMVGSSMAVYGQWYSDLQKENYYRNEAKLTLENKKVAANQVELLYRQSDVLKRQAQDAHQLAFNTRRLNEYAEGKLRSQNDATYADAYARMARSGVAMDYGSPMEMMNDLVESEAEAYGIKKWQGKMNANQADMGAYESDVKSTIALTQANIAKENLKMYDYQSEIYKRSADEVQKASTMKQWAIATKFAADSMAKY